MSRVLRVWIAMLMVVAIAGCDRRSGSTPQSKVPPASMPDLAPRPTTQELLTGPYDRFMVPGIPVSIQAPKSWKISNASRLTVLEGATPSADMMIQIALRDAIRPADVDTFIQHMQREGERQPGTLKRMNVRNQGKAQIIEQLFEERPLTSARTDLRGLAVTDAKGNIVMTTVTPLHWMVTILVPGPKAYDHYDVNCIGLTTDEYAMNKEFLEKVLGSVVYEEAQAPASTP